MINPKVLVIGFGNPGRMDDGLGPALAAWLESDIRANNYSPLQITVECDYQLNIEHAALAAEHDIVIFADAATDTGNEPFYFHPFRPAPDSGFSSHSVSPAGILHLAQTCFNARPHGYLLGIGAEDVTSFAEGLTPSARKNLEQAQTMLHDFLRSLDSNPA